MKRRALQVVYVVLFVLTALVSSSKTGQAGWFSRAWYPMYAPASPRTYRSYYVGYRGGYYPIRYAPRYVYYRSGYSPCATSCSPCATSCSPCGTACASGNCTVNSPTKKIEPIPMNEVPPKKTFAGDEKVPDPDKLDPDNFDPSLDEPGAGPRKTEKSPTPTPTKTQAQDPAKKTVEEDRFKQPIKTNDSADKKTDPVPEKTETPGSAKVDELPGPGPIRTLPDSPLSKRPPAGTDTPKAKAPFNPFGDEPFGDEKKDPFGDQKKKTDSSKADDAGKSAADVKPLPVPSLKLEEKITWRTVPTRTRINVRASFGNPKVVRTRVDINRGWVTLPTGSKIVAK